MRWLIVLLSVAEAGWMVFDGGRALTIGDYVTPASGPYAGRLGPWAAIVSAVGIAPRSTTMKVAFVAFGTAWLACAVAFARRVPWAWTAMLAGDCLALVRTGRHITVGASDRALIIAIGASRVSRSARHA